VRNPGIYIGLGGASMRTLIKLKAMILEEYNNDLTSFKAQNKFIFIDSNPNDYESIQNDNSLIEIFKGKPIDEGEFLNITETYYYPPLEFNSISKDVQWYEVEPDRSSSLPNSRPITRMEARFALLYNLKVVEDAIISAVFSSELVPTLHVIAGSCGNTGSAIALDIIQLLNEHANRRFSRAIERYIEANLTLLAPERFIRLNKPEGRLSLNAYATFWEMNAFYSLGNDQTNFFNLTPKIENKYQLFIQLIDAENTHGKNLELDDFYEQAAAVVNSMGVFDIYWGMGERIHPMIAHRIFKLNENIIDVFQGKIVNKNEWHPIVFSGATISCEYPITEFQRYIQLRFKDELLNKYLIGHSFNSIHGQDNLEDKHMTIKSYLQKIFAFDAGNYVTAPENLRMLISNRILDKLELRRLDIEKNRFLGFSIGFKKNAFIKSWYAFKIKLEKEISDIKQTYYQGISSSSNALIKVEIIHKIKDNINQILNDLVLNNGCQYAYDVFQQLADALDSSEGQEYLEHLNLLNINDELKIIESKIKDLDSTIEIQAKENKDEDNFLQSIDRYVDLQIDCFYLEIAKDLIQTIMMDASNNLGVFKNPSSHEFNIITTLEKLKIEAQQASINYNKLKDEFSAQQPLIKYLPALNTMVDGDDWKIGSDFDVAYGEIFGTNMPYSKSRKNLEDLIYWLSNYLRYDLHDKTKKNFFSEVLMKFFSFSGFEFQKMFIDDLINNKLIIDDLCSICLDAILNKSEYRNRRFNQMNISETILKMSHNPEQSSALEEFRSSFINLTEFFPIENDKEDLTLMQIYHSSKENNHYLKDVIWPHFGFEINNRFNLIRENNNDFSTSKTVFRLGYALNDYKYFKNYESAINEIITQNRLTDFKGCFTNKYFLKLDIDQAIRDLSM
jgi:hypothetical protein